MLYKEKLIISGKFLEHFQYEKWIEKGFKLKENKSPTLKHRGRAVAAEQDKKLINRMKVMQKARSTIKRLINANVNCWNDSKGRIIPAKFFTITHAENITAIKYSNNKFRSFIKRLNRFLGYKAEYVAVIEFQKRGAIHYHVIFFNLPYIKKKELSNLWGRGYVQINRIKHVNNVGAYVSKYMGKDLEDERLYGEKCYFCSRGLHKPIEIVDSESIRAMLNILEGQLLKGFENSYENEYTGLIKYKQYYLIG